MDTQNFKQFFKEFFEEILKEDEDVPEKDKPKIQALKKKTAYNKVKEKIETQKSQENNVRVKQDALRAILKDKTNPDQKEAAKIAKIEIEKAKDKAKYSKQITNAAKIELNSIK